MSLKSSAALEYSADFRRVEKKNVYLYPLLLDSYVPACNVILVQV